MSRYRVKFVDARGKAYFGVVSSYSAEAKTLAKRGLALVSDAVLPVTYTIAESALTDIPYTFESRGKYNSKTGDYEGGDEYELHVRAAFKAADEAAKKLKPGVQVGALFAVGVADGQAWYTVTKVTKKRATIEWRGFGGDRYHDHFFGSGRTLDIVDVAPYIQRAAALNKLFGRENDL